MSRDATLDIDGAAKVLKASPETVRELAPRIPGAAKIGRAWVFVTSDLIEWVREQSKIQRAARTPSPSLVPPARRKHARRVPPKLPEIEA